MTCDSPAEARRKCERAVSSKEKPNGKSHEESHDCEAAPGAEEISAPAGQGRGEEAPGENCEAALIAAHLKAKGVTLCKAGYASGGEGHHSTINQLNRFRYRR